MSLVIASQLDADFNKGLVQHPIGPVVIDVAEDEPWTAAAEADLLLVRPTPAWRQPPVARPSLWPGRLKWVYSASAGVDFYPEWLLDAPLVTCGRGVASDEIAEVGEVGHGSLCPDAVRSASALRAMPGQPTQGRADTLVLRRAGDMHPLGLWRCGVIGAAAAGEQLSLRVEHARFRGRELASHAHDLAANGEVSRHRHGMIIDA